MPPSPLDIALVSAAMADVSSALMDPAAIYVEVGIRTRPHEPFDYVEPDAEFTDVQIWLERRSDRFEQGRMRIEKKERKIVFDGTNTLFHMITHGEAKFFPGGRIDRQIADPAQWLASLAPTDRADVAVDTFVAADGVRETQVTIREEGDVLAEGEHPGHFPDFDRRTVVSWGADTQRLRNIEKYVDHEGREVLISTIRSIQYVDGFEVGVFAHDLADSVHIAEVTDPGNPELAKLTPEEVTRRYFGAWMQKDWDGMRLFCEYEVYIWYARMNPIASYRVTGTRFKAMERFPGWMVPYEIVFEGGGTKRFRLALKHNRTAQRWMLSGGI